METQNTKEMAIKELKRLIDRYDQASDTPRAIGGPFSLSPREMLTEVENDTETGRQIMEAFAKLWREFPQNSSNQTKDT